MGWLSSNSPTIARLIGGRGQTSGKVKKSRGRGRRSAETPQPEIDDSVLESDSSLEPETDSAVGVAIAEDEPADSEMEADIQALTEETTATPPASPDSVSADSVPDGSEPTDQESARSDTPRSPVTPVSPATKEESGQLGTGAAQASGQSLGQTPATISSANNIEQMYNTCVELEGTIVAAQSELRALLANRANAEAMRSQAHEAMEQADSAWQEAGLLGQAAWRAFERGFSVDTPEFVNRLRVIREVDEARKAQAQLQRGNNLEAWKEADRARQNATADILKALTALAAAAAQVSRELRETNYLPESADSLRNSAMDDLRCAHVIGEELAILGQEALGQLGAGKLAEQAQIQEQLANEATARQSSTHPPTGDATPLPDFSDRPEPNSEPEPVPQNVPPAPEPRPAISNTPAARPEPAISNTPAPAARPAPAPEPAREAPPAPSAARSDASLSGAFSSRTNVGCGAIQERI